MHTDKTGLSILFFIRVHPRSSVVKILPMEKGASSPFTEDSGNSVRLAYAKGLQDPSPYRLGDLAVQQSTIINPQSSIVNLTMPPPTTLVYRYCENCARTHSLGAATCPPHHPYSAIYEHLPSASHSNSV